MNNCEFMALQERLIAGDKSAMNEMYLNLYTLALKTINKYAPCKLPVSERQKKAHDAATSIIEKYLTKSDFQIKKNFSSYMYKCVSFQLYGENRRKIDKLIQFTDNVPERGTTKKIVKYIVTDIKTDSARVYENSTELLLNPVFRTLRKKRLIECIQTGKKWKHYHFDIVEE